MYLEVEDSSFVPFGTMTPTTHTVKVLHRPQKREMVKGGVPRKGKWSKGGIPPLFLVKRGYRKNTAAGGAPTCPKLPQFQF